MGDKDKANPQDSGSTPQAKRDLGGRGNLFKRSGTYVKELRPHALWDAIKFMWHSRTDWLPYVATGAAIMYGVIVALIQKLRGVPVDWFIIASLIFVALLSMIIGVVLGRRRNRAIQSISPIKATTPSEEIPAELAAPHLKILTPLDREQVGWHRTVRGSIYPPDSELQLLIQPPDGWWYLQSGPVVVRGRAWSFNGEFGEQGKAGYPYKVVAVHGRSLTDERYKALPENLVKSAVITVHRRMIEDVIDCSDLQLHQTRINDRNMIPDLVKVCSVKCGTHIDATVGDDRQYVDFYFSFLNLSLFPVSIESVLGSIAFRKETSPDKILLDWHPKLEDNSAALNRPFRAFGWFKIRQFIAPQDAPTVASGSDKSEFYFENLIIIVTGGGVAGVRLAIPLRSIEKKGKDWIASDECDFVFASIAEAEAKIRELETASESPQSQKQQLINGLPIRLIHAKSDYSTDPKLSFPSKVRCEFKNISSVSIKVRNSEWIPGAGGITADLRAATLQIRIAGRWYPPEGMEEVHVPPGERFRSWIAPGKQFTADEVQRRCVAKELGTIVFLVNGQELKLSL